jgi:hypothetical protein
MKEGKVAGIDINGICAKSEFALPDPNAFLPSMPPGRDRGGGERRQAIKRKYQYPQPDPFYLPSSVLSVVGLSVTYFAGSYQYPFGDRFGSNC